METFKGSVFYSEAVLECYVRRILLFSGEGNLCSTVLKRTGALLFTGEGN